MEFTAEGNVDAQADNFDGDLTQYQMTNFRLFRIERLCRRQFQI